MHLSTLNLLLIDDSPEGAALLVRAIELGGYDVVWERIDTSAALAAALSRQVWDLVVADYTTAAFDGVEAVDIVRQRDPDLPFIFVSNVRGEDLAVAAMRTGAHDYILKMNLQRLLPSVERQLREAAVRRERHRVERRLAHLAYHDALTDL